MNKYIVTCSIKGLMEARVSKCNRLTVVRRRKILLALRNFFRFVCASWKVHAFIHFLNFLSIFTHFMCMSRGFLAPF